MVSSAVINAVFTQQGWKIYTMHTVAEKLKQFPEIPPPDGHMTGPVSWEKQRAAEIDAANPEILIIGGGQKLVYIFHVLMNRTDPLFPSIVVSH